MVTRLFVSLLHKGEGQDPSPAKLLGSRVAQDMGWERVIWWGFAVGLERRFSSPPMQGQMRVPGTASSWDHSSVDSPICGADSPSRGVSAAVQS